VLLLLLLLLPICCPLMSFRFIYYYVLFAKKSLWLLCFLCKDEVEIVHVVPFYSQCHYSGLHPRQMR